MRPRLERVSTKPSQSFLIEERRLRRFDAPWHFHPEIELTLIVEGRGRRFVGDSIESFGPGDLVLIGSNVPHFWHNDPEPARRRLAHSVVAQFRYEFLGQEFFSAPELSRVRRLINLARRGLHFSGRAAQQTGARLRQLAPLRELAALTGLLQTLDELTAASARPLASESYAPQLNPIAGERLARVYDFLTRHFQESLTLPQIARVAAMTPESFSRYFKRTAGRNVSEVLNDLRIDYAAHTLLGSDRRVADIALEAGFATLSNFNRRFLASRRMTPRAYRKTFESADASVLTHGPRIDRF